MSAIDTFVTGVGSSVLSSLLAPPSYVAAKAAWAAMPAQNLPIEWYWHLFNNGLMVPTDFQQVANEQGFECNAWNFGDYRLFDVNPATNRVRVNTARLVAPGRMFSKYLQLNKLVLTPQECLLLLNREMISEGVAYWMIKNHFKGEQHLARKYMELRFEIPPLTDLIHFAVKEAFDPATIERMGYNKELPVEILPWMRKLGYGGQSGMRIPPGATTNRGPETRTQAEWLDHYWYSHWDNLSPSQWFEALHRFYAASPRGPSPELTPLNRTSLDDVQAGLKVNDYPEPLRNRLISMSYTPLTRVDVRRMHKLGILDDNSVYHAYRAIGYNDANAENLLRFTKEDTNRASFNATKAKVLRGAEKQVRLGMINQFMYTAIVTGVGISVRESEARFTAIRAEANADWAKEHLAKIRRWYLAGTINEQQTRQVLNTMTFEQEAIDEYLRVWTMEKNMGRKYIAANKLVDLFKKRIINEQVLTTKLFNLGYQSSEISLILVEARTDINSLAAKETKKLTDQRTKDEVKAANERKREVEKRLREEKAANKEFIRENEKRVNKALAAFTQPNLIAWFKAGTINEETVEIVLGLKGWTDAAIQAFKETNLGIETENGESTDESTEESEA